MIRINRSTDLRNDTVWVAIDHDEETQRCRQLYLGTDVNGAVKAAIEAGLPREDAIAAANAALSRREVNDAVTV